MKETVEKRYKFNEYDFPSAGHTGHKIISMVLYENITIKEAAKILCRNPKVITKFLDELSSSDDMKIKYNLKQLTSGKNNTVITSSFQAKEPLSENEFDYGNIPKRDLQLGWVLPKELNYE